ncbi:MAG: hypothetical protein KatS3mg119_1506 [Rhodothalassiaceae bacterium]|nr:MAG: hypothetical protein KatS3mg119_1506 [Rhodothalassiaceae bacterium]
MPTVLKDGPYRIFFYSNEAGELPHVHVQRDRALAKFWLEPVAVARSHGFSPRELGRIVRLVEAHRERLLERWHDFFGKAT